LAPRDTNSNSEVQLEVKFEILAQTSKNNDTVLCWACS